jgi:hypothetical protein
MTRHIPGLDDAEETQRNAEETQRNAEEAQRNAKEAQRNAEETQRNAARRITPWLTPALVCIAACAGPAAAPVPLDPAAAEVQAEVRAMYADLSAREWEKFASHFAEGAVVLFKGRKPVPIAEFIAHNRKALEGKEVFGEECLELDVRVHRDLAHAWSRFRGRVGSAEKVTTWSGIDAYTLLRIEGRWRIAAIAVSTDG